MATQFCPNCGTPRTGQFRFCPTCALDFESLGAQGVAEGPRGDPAASPAEVVVPPLSKASSRRGWVALGVVIFLAIVAAAAFVGLSNSGALRAHHDITGSFLLLNSTSSHSIDATGSSCVGVGGYADVKPGQPVILKDGEGKILATSSLGFGSGNVTRCEFRFTLLGVPEVPFYSIEIGRRGQVTNSLADMQSTGWVFDLTLGS